MHVRDVHQTRFSLDISSIAVVKKYPLKFKARRIQIMVEKNDEIKHFYVWKTIKHKSYSKK